MEAAVNGLGYTPAKDGVEPVQIPFRDQQDAGTTGRRSSRPSTRRSTARSPRTPCILAAVNNSEYDTLPVAELRRRSAINVDVAGAAMRATLAYARTHRASIIADQIEVFRRGATGAAQVPVSAETVPGVPGIGPEDVYTTDFPRAYVIPAGGAQRSATAAARLCRPSPRQRRPCHPRDPRLPAGRTVVREGLDVVDLHQPKRGLANVMLADGRNISDKVSVMYDISGWSLGRLWGATVVPVRSGGCRPWPPVGSKPPHGSGTSPRVATCVCVSTPRRRSPPSTPFSTAGFRYGGSRTAVSSCRDRRGRGPPLSPVRTTWPSTRPDRPGRPKAAR